MKHKALFSLMISILFVFVLCAAAFAEETQDEPDRGPAPEAAIRHQVWGFFSAWAEGDTDRLELLCAEAWKKEKADPVKALQEILQEGAPHGYTVDGISGKAGDPFLTVCVVMQREAGSGYTYSRHEVVFRQDPDGYYAIDPEGIRQGEPAEAVPEQELTLLTPEGIIRSSMEAHMEEGLYDRLVPINAVVEKNGIRVEVISGLAREDVVMFLMSVQDTEGKFTAYNLDPSFIEDADYSTSGGWGELYHDKAENKSTYIYYRELDRPLRPSDGPFTAGVEGIRMNVTKRIDLLPMLEQYGRTEEGVAPPAYERRGYEGEAAVPADVKFLDYTKPLDILLFKGVYLTGIGWINNQLHVQFHNKGVEYKDTINGRTEACSVWVDATVYGKTYDEIYVDYSPLRWDGNGNGWNDWKEFFINCTPEDAYRLILDAEITVTEFIMNGNWSVTIPQDQITVPEGTEE